MKLSIMKQQNKLTASYPQLSQPDKAGLPSLHAFTTSFFVFTQRNVAEANKSPNCVILG